MSVRIHVADCWHCFWMNQSFVALAALTLRSPQNAKKAVEAGVVQIAAAVMEKHPTAGPMQRQACQMLRNLAVRNPENRYVLQDSNWWTTWCATWSAKYQLKINHDKKYIQSEILHWCLNSIMLMAGPSLWRMDCLVWSKRQRPFTPMLARMWASLLSEILDLTTTLTCDSASWQCS